MVFKMAVSTYKFRTKDDMGLTLSGVTIKRGSSTFGTSDNSGCLPTGCTSAYISGPGTTSEFRAYKSGYVSQTKSVYFPTYQHDIEIVFMLEKVEVAQSWYRIRTKDDRGQPLGGVRIDKGSFYLDTTDSNGCLPAGCSQKYPSTNGTTYQIRAGKSGYISDMKTINFPNYEHDMEIVFMLEKIPEPEQSYFRVRTRNQAGAPLGGVRIEKAGYLGTTDAAGCLPGGCTQKYPSTPGQTALFKATKTGYEDLEKSVYFPTYEHDMEILLSLVKIEEPEQCSYSITVRDANGDPISTAQLRIDGSLKNTGSDGYYPGGVGNVIPIACGTSIVVKASKWGYVEQTHTFTIQSPAHAIVFYLQETEPEPEPDPDPDPEQCSYSIMVRDADTQMPLTAPLVIDGRTKNTGSDGYYPGGVGQVIPVPCGTVMIVKASKWGYIEQTHTFTIQSPSQQIVFNLHKDEDSTGGGGGEWTENTMLIALGAVAGLGAWWYLTGGKKKLKKLMK